MPKIIGSFQPPSIVIERVIDWELGDSMIHSGDLHDIETTVCGRVKFKGYGGEHFEIEGDILRDVKTTDHTKETPIGLETRIVDEWYISDEDKNYNPSKLRVTITSFR